MGGLLAALSRHRGRPRSLLTRTVQAPASLSPMGPCGPAGQTAPPPPHHLEFSHICKVPSATQGPGDWGQHLCWAASCTLFFPMKRTSCLGFHAPPQPASCQPISAVPGFLLAPRYLLHRRRLSAGPLLSLPTVSCPAPPAPLPLRLKAS